MGTPDSSKSKSLWPWWVIGIFVVPLCLGLTVGLPYRILCDRDMTLNGQEVTARVVAFKDLWTKSGAMRQFQYDYTIDGRSYTEWLVGPPGTQVGSEVALVYAPRFPWHARLSRPVRPWDENLWARLLISWTLALIFGVAWVSGLRAARRAQ